MPEIRPETFPAHLPPRPRDCHKGDFGAVGVLGGAPGMAGAALLAGRAALLCGAGRVYVGLLDERIACDPAAPELMLASPRQALHAPAPACLVAGPGLGRSGAARDWLAQALGSPHPVLLDADALNLLAGDAELRQALAARAAPALLTPHPGEAGRLLGMAAADIQADRAAAIHALAQRYRAGVVLKGAGSLVLTRDGTLWRNATGNPGMAAPGMGDVLAGMIAALAAQGLTLDQAAVMGVWLHGAAGDLAVSRGAGPLGLTASELLPAAREILNRGRGA
ncbi:MAG: NAD(P)H-hydrate dehydratase [Pseudomonadota bacterium]